VYPRCDSPFDILLGFSGSLAKIETLDGEAHVSPPENAKLTSFSDGFSWRIIDLAIVGDRVSIKPQ
jgi:hypothetical protein